MRRIFKFIVGLLLLIADAPIVMAFAREMYGPFALILFLTAAAIGSAGLFLIAMSIESRRGYIRRW